MIERQAPQRRDAAADQGFKETRDAVGAAFGRTDQATSARLEGSRAWLAAATTALAPAAAAILYALGADMTAALPAALAAAPLAAAATAAAVWARPAPLALLALSQAPLFAVAAWLAWSSGGLASPFAPWAFAVFAAAAALGGALGGLTAAAAAALIGALAASPIGALITPAPDLSLIGYAPPDARAAAGLIGWTSAAAALGLVIKAAALGYAEALPALRHPVAAAREALARLAEDAGVAALRLDGDGVVVDCVGAPATAFNLAGAEAVGVSLLDLAHPDDRPSVERLLDAQGDDPTPTRVRLRDRFGGFHWVEAELGRADAYPRRADLASDGERLVVLRARRFGASPSIGVDLTRAGLLAHVHDGLRRELKSVVGYTDILQSEVFGPLGSARYRDYARQAHDGGAHLLELIDELLELAEVDAGRVGVEAALVDPMPLIDGAAQLARRRAERMGVGIDLEIPPMTPHIRTDRRALRRILVNLLSDAARRAQIGDRLTLRAELDADAIAFSLVLRRPAETAPTALALAEPARPAPSRAHPDADAATADRTAAETGGVSALGEARLGRLVAHSLTEALGGALLFADGDDAYDRFASLAPGGERAVVEAIFPLTGPPATRRGGAPATLFGGESAAPRLPAPTANGSALGEDGYAAQDGAQDGAHASKDDGRDPDAAAARPKTPRLRAPRRAVDDTAA